MSLWRALLRTETAGRVIPVRLPVGPAVLGAGRWSLDAWLAGTGRIRNREGRR